MFVMKDNAILRTRTWERPPDTLALAEGEVHVWSVPLEPRRDELAKLATLLSPDERERASRFRKGRDRDRFIVRRGRLRVVLAGYTCIAPGQLRFQYGAHGKPTLAIQGEACSIRFNASSSHDVALLAVAKHRDIGVDVEAVRPLPNMQEVVAEHFSEPEQKAWRALVGYHQLAAFFSVWTRKEAILKALGAGLSIPPDRVDASLIEKPCGHTGWSLEPLAPAKGYVGTLATPGDSPRLGRWHYPVLP